LFPFEASKRFALSPHTSVESLYWNDSVTREGEGSQDLLWSGQYEEQAEVDLKDTG